MIEKLDGLDWDYIHPRAGSKLLNIKINELIDAYADNERNRSEQMARVLKRLERLESTESKDDKEIKDCPFCGSHAVIEGSDTKWISCPTCGVETSGSSCKEEAIRIWNKRA